MGASWRVGVDPDERTRLVTAGVYRVVRNPILTATIATFTGLVLMVPTVVAVVGLAAVVVGVQLQVRLVEEPILLRAHGDVYQRYRRTVGRFLPGVGRSR
jgi:protein-S-isoprenylcysteine O-methyltransferase Ste14